MHSGNFIKSIYQKVYVEQETHFLHQSLSY